MKKNQILPVLSTQKDTDFLLQLAPIPLCPQRSQHSSLPCQLLQNQVWSILPGLTFLAPNPFQGLLLLWHPPKTPAKELVLLRAVPPWPGHEPFPTPVHGLKQKGKVLTFPESFSSALR